MTTVQRFGRVEIVPTARQVRVDGVDVTLGGRAFDVLVALVERRDRVVTKDELLALAWPGLVVEENNLQVQISTLRRALGHDAIATVAGRGYRFVLLPEKKGDKLAGRLPLALISLIGREGEIADVVAMLGHRRLVTFVGVGGIGKTSLALATARAASQDYADGAWFADLSQLVDPRLVAGAVAITLGIEDLPGTPPIEQIRRHCATRHLLLVLDNCEHLLESCSQLAQAVLESVSRVSIIATSREPLHILGEAVYQVHPLHTPDAPAECSLEAIHDYAAVRVFVERAAAARPDFKLHAGNVAAVAQVCRDVDGIPLALELAASRVRHLPVSVIAERLADRFHMLKRVDTANLRHHTLRATLDWSYDLLSDTERALLCRLSVFAGGFTVDAAEAVGKDVASANEDVLDLLGHLVDKSLVGFDAREERYRLLETVRQYAQYRLEESCDGPAARLAHTCYFAELARSATDDELIGPHQRPWQLRFEKEHNNFLAMHAHALTIDGGVAADLELAGMFRWLPLTQHGHWYHVVQEALAHPGGREPSLARCRALSAATFLAYVLGHYSDARAFAEEGLLIAGHLGDKQRLASAHGLMGMALLGERSGEALSHLQAGYALARELGDARWIVHAAAQLGEGYAAQARYDLAEPYYLESLDHARAPGSAADTMANALLNLVLCDVARGDGGKALDHLREAIPLGDVGRSSRHAFAVVASCALVAPLLGDGTTAARMLGATEASAQRHAVVMEPSIEAAMAQAATRARALLDSDGLATAWAAGRTLDDAAALAESCAWVEEKSG